MRSVGGSQRTCGGELRYALHKLEQYRWLDGRIVQHHTRAQPCEQREQIARQQRPLRAQRWGRSELAPHQRHDLPGQLAAAQRRHSPCAHARHDMLAVLQCLRPHKAPAALSCFAALSLLGSQCKCVPTSCPSIVQLNTSAAAPARVPELWQLRCAVRVSPTDCGHQWGCSALMVDQCQTYQQKPLLTCPINRLLQNIPSIVTNNAPDGPFAAILQLQRHSDMSRHWHPPHAAVVSMGLTSAHLAVQSASGSFQLSELLQHGHNFCGVAHDCLQVRLIVPVVPARSTSYLLNASSAPNRLMGCMSAEGQPSEGTSVPFSKQMTVIYIQLLWPSHAFAVHLSNMYGEWKNKECSCHQVQIIYLSTLSARCAALTQPAV